MTGPPGVGKTTVLMKAVGMLKEKGVVFGGIITRERKERGQRTGFELIDLATGKRGTLASVSQRDGPRVGKYRVSLSDILRIAVSSLEEALASSEVVVIDEVGPMELYSPDFRRVVKRVFEGPRPVVAIVHATLGDPLIKELKANPSATKIEITLANRDSLPDMLAKEVLEVLEGTPR